MKRGDTKRMNKKSIITKGIAVSLAVALLIGGGTFAYLQSESNNIENKFRTNQVNVSLEETTGGDYNIIPGTEQKKDPKVTVMATVPAYVYVEVTDATEGLINYEIAEGWKKLGDFGNIYYREVENSNSEQEFNVLKNDMVSYDSSLENEDMLNENGTLKDGIKLTFKASAVQKEPFNDPIKAYYQSETDVATEDDLQSALESAEDNATILVSADIVLNKSVTIPTGKKITLALAGHTITGSTSDSAVKVEENASLDISDGTILAASGQSGIYNDKGTVTIENLIVKRDEECNSNNTYVIVNHGNMTMNDGVHVEAPHSGSSLVENGYQDGSGETQPVYLTINGGNYIGGLNPVKNDDWGILEINDGYFECKANKQYCVVNFNDLTIKGGTFVSDYRVVWNGNLNDTYDKGNVTVTGGDFSATIMYMFFDARNAQLGNNVTTTEKGMMLFSGGTFRDDNNYNESRDFAGPTKGWKVAEGYTIKNNGDGSCSVVPK